MRKGVLIIFSGLPGSGKSTLACRLATLLSATYLRIDTVEQGLREICNISEIEGMGYRLSYRIAKENLFIGTTVIADSVNPWKLTRNEWNDVADSIGARFVNIEVICSDREEHKRRVESRTSPVPGLILPSWEDILNRDYHPWEQERISIDTSGKAEARCFNELVSKLENIGIKAGE